MARHFHHLILFVFLALVAGCSRSNDAELAKAQAEADAAKAELEALKATQARAAEKPEPKAAANQIEPVAAPSLPASLANEPWSREWDVIANAENPQDAIREADKHLLHGWFEGDPIASFPNRPYFEGAGKHTGLLVLHPVSGQEPAKVKFQGQVPADRPFLTVVAGGSVHGDTILRCVVNGATISEFTLDGKKWTNCEFDLSEYAGTPAAVELWNVAGGSKPWYFETCYIDRIEFTSASKPVAAATAATPTTPPPGPVVFEHTLLKPGMRRQLNFFFGQYGSKPKYEAGSGLKLSGGHHAPAAWAKQYLGEKYRVEFEMKLDTEHAWMVCVLNGPGYGNSHNAGYGCRMNQRNVTFLRDGKEQDTVERPETNGEWARIRADVDGGNIEVMLDGAVVAAFEDPEPLTGPLNGWFGLVGREVVFRNLKIWSPEADTNRERQLTPPVTETPTPNGELLYELDLASGALGSEWFQSQPKNTNVKDGALVLAGSNGTPDVLLKNPLTPELACEVEFEYPDHEAVNFKLMLLSSAQLPESLESQVGWFVELPRGDGTSAIRWQSETDSGEGVWKKSPLLASTGYYAPVPQRKYVARAETHGDEIRVFLDGGLLLKATRPTSPPATPIFFGLRQIYGGSKVHSARIYKIGG